MDKDIFYNEHVKNTLDYAAVTNQATPQQVLDLSDKFYDKASVNIYKRNTGNKPYAELSDVHYTDIPLSSANRFLKTSAAGLSDDEQECYFVHIKWRDKHRPNDERLLKGFMGNIYVYQKALQ